ncbi:hypothetical protein PVBG_05883 [Plasmodium vivax Brazil I]|uniref:Variable surface protein n=1 Tax=Plasmodium vivax (strain Brazil I) TaxID=1033975 RepID=A0A0J9SQA3_PLAV1|nr:hypothetical protein PVBG_05883 [Plasmodium vivax Brazil I]
MTLKIAYSHIIQNVYQFSFMIYDYVHLFFLNKPEFDVISSQDNSDNEGLCDTFYTTNFQGDNNKQIFCKTCAKCLQYSTEIKNKSLINVNTRCKYMNYLLYKEVFEEELSEYNMVNFYKKLKEQHNDILYICYIYIENINKNTFEKLQKINDMYENLNMILNESQSSEKCDCKCAQNIVQSYKSYFDICIKDNNTKFCNALDMFRIIYNNYIKNIHMCEGVPTYLESFNGPSLEVVLLITFVIILALIFILSILFKVNKYIFF